jgi:WhiB family transcriptional regulator, redox-sensing transcriptional regulator
LSDEAGKLAAGQEVQPVLVTSRPRRGRREPRDLTDGELAGRVYRQARCAGSPVDPDDWFPVTHDVAKARDQAAQAIAVCARCPVRPDCLELSLRHACGIGAHGVWGGLVEEERRSLRRRWLAGTSVTEFLTGARSGPVQPGEPAYRNQRDGQRDHHPRR